MAHTTMKSNGKGIRPISQFIIASDNISLRSPISQLYKKENNSNVKSAVTHEAYNIPNIFLILNVILQLSSLAYNIYVISMKDQETYTDTDDSNMKSNSV